MPSHFCPGHPGANPVLAISVNLLTSEQGRGGTCNLRLTGWWVGKAAGAGQAT